MAKSIKKIRFEDLSPWLKLGYFGGIVAAIEMLTWWIIIGIKILGG